MGAQRAHLGVGLGMVAPPQDRASAAAEQERHGQNLNHRTLALRRMNESVKALSRIIRNLDSIRHNRPGVMTKGSRRM